jgi:hypothetical protein
MTDLARLERLSVHVPSVPGAREVPYVERHRTHPPSRAASEDALARFPASMRR